MKLDLVHKSALHVLGWGLLAALSFFFHAVGFIVVCIFLFMKMSEFSFIYTNTKEKVGPHAGNATRVTPDVSDSESEGWDGPVFPDQVGTYRERRLRENLPEGKG